MASQSALAQTGGDEPGTEDWAVAKDLSLSLDSSGYNWPSAIAVVPNPGVAPDDPLYFVAELRGTLKVVTNDRSVHVFSTDISNVQPNAEMPAESGEVGMAGICLDPVHGYVFVTYAYTDVAGVLRNNVTRFASSPGVFSRQPEGRLDFTEVFANDESVVSHQIGPCQVDGDALYVSVGNGQDLVAAEDIHSTLGKILRMTLDGKPFPGNPFMGPDAHPGAADYVWAFGLRNPFSLRVVQGRVFVADNGPGVDRFFEATRGEDYAFDGSDWSMGLNAAMVFGPAVSPVGMDYQAGDAGGLAPLYEDVFYLALAGPPQTVGRNHYGAKSVIALSYDFVRGRLVEVPRKIVEYVGDSTQLLVGVGVAGDGLYVVPIMPDSNGVSGILKVTYKRGAVHPRLVGGPNDAWGLMQARNCYGCHRDVDGAAPSLDRARLTSAVTSRLASPAYLELVSGLGDTARKQVAAILAMQGEPRVRAWIIQQIRTPGFDNPDATMPNQRLNLSESAAITDILLGTPSSGPPQSTTIDFESLYDDLKSVLNSPRRILAFGLAAGFLAGAFLCGVFYLIVARSRVRKRLA